MLQDIVAATCLAGLIGVLWYGYNKLTIRELIVVGAVSFSHMLGRCETHHFPEGYNSAAPLPGEEPHYILYIALLWAVAWLLSRGEAK